MAVLLPCGKSFARSKSLGDQNRMYSVCRELHAPPRTLRRSKSCFDSLCSELAIDRLGTKSDQDAPLCRSRTNEERPRGQETRVAAAVVVVASLRQHGRRRSEGDALTGQSKCLHAQSRSKSTADVSAIAVRDVRAVLLNDNRQEHVARSMLMNDSPGETTSNGSVATVNLELNEFLQRLSGDPVPDYFYYECCICYAQSEDMQLLTCLNCRQLFCLPCLKRYVKEQIRNGCIQLTCPEIGCGRIYPDVEVEMFSEQNLMDIYRKNHTEALCDPRVKACPGCNMVHRLDKSETIPQQLTCSKCNLSWCFTCHAPWHVGMTCKSYREDVQGEGKRALKVWAKSKGKNVKNARKCPKCKFFIERIAGCDHMTCSRCSTEFCYSCGKRFVSLGILGSHYSRFSFLGCKYNLLPKRPMQRIAVRSAVACAAPLLIVGSILLLPIAVPVLATVYIKRKGCC